MSSMYILYNMEDSRPPKAKLSDTHPGFTLHQSPKHGDTVASLESGRFRPPRFRQNMIEDTSTHLRSCLYAMGRMATLICQERHFGCGNLEQSYKDRRSDLCACYITAVPSHYITFKASTHISRISR